MNYVNKKVNNSSNISSCYNQTENTNITNNNNNNTNNNNNYYTRNQIILTDHNIQNLEENNIALSNKTSSNIPNNNNLINTNNTGSKSTKNKNKNYIKENFQNFTDGSNTKNNNNSNTKNKTNIINNTNNKTDISKRLLDSQAAHQMQINNTQGENQDEDSQSNHGQNYEEYEEANKNEIQKLNNNYIEELQENLKNLGEENNYIKELNENVIKELNELRELSQNLEDENLKKENLFEELNEKILEINQKLVDSVAELNNQKSENMINIQEHKDKINELLNELNITKLTNQALYAEINRRDNKQKQDKSNNNYEQEENEEDFNECYTNNNNNFNNYKDENEIGNNNNTNNINYSVFNSLNNKDEDEKYILNMEIEKQIGENIQSKQLIESLSYELESLKSKYDSISKEYKQIQEACKSLKNANSLLEKKIEKLNKESVAKETLITNKLNSKIKEIESLEKSINELTAGAKEKSDIAEMSNLNNLSNLNKLNNNLNSEVSELIQQLTSSKNYVNELQMKIKVLVSEKDSFAEEALVNLEGLEKAKAENKQLVNQNNQNKLCLQEKLSLIESQKSAIDLRYLKLENEYNALYNEAEELKKDKDAESKQHTGIVKKYDSLLLEKKNLEASNSKLHKEVSELIKKKFSAAETEKDEKINFLLSKIEDLESELRKLNSCLSSNEIEIKLAHTKNEELKSEIKSLSKSSDNNALELINFRRTEENLKNEIKNMLKSEENYKAEIKARSKKEEKSLEDAKRFKADFDLLLEKNKKMDSDLREKSNKIDILRLEMDEFNAAATKAKSALVDNEGLLKLEKLENERLIRLVETLSAEVKKHIEAEHYLEEHNKALLQSDEKLKAEIKSLILENETYKENLNSNNNNKNVADEELINKIRKLEIDNKKLFEDKNSFESAAAKLIEINRNIKREKEDFEAKLKAADKDFKALKLEKDNFRAEAENLKVLTEDYDSKCERISELENKISKLKQERNNKNNNVNEIVKDEVDKLSKLLSEKAEIIKVLEEENAKLQKENGELNTSTIVAAAAATLSLNNTKMETFETNKDNKNYEDLESEKLILLEKLSALDSELESEKENRTKLKSLNETQLNYLLKFSDKFLEINNNALDSIEHINAKFTHSDYLYQIPILDILEEINFSQLKETFVRIRSNNIAESYNAILSFFSGFFEAKVLKIPETINQNIRNIETKMLKIYEDYQAKLPLYAKAEKDLKNLTEKIKNFEIEKVNLATLLDGKEQECEQISYKLADTEKKYKNYRESQKSNSEKHETKIENLEKEKNKLLEALSNLQAELELVLDENEKLKNEKDQLGNLENIGFAEFLKSNSHNNNLLDNINKNKNENSNRIGNSGDKNFYNRHIDKNFNNIGNCNNIDNNFESNNYNTEGVESDNYNNEGFAHFNLNTNKVAAENTYNKDSFSHRKSKIGLSSGADEEEKPFDDKKKVLKTLSLTDVNIISEAAPQGREKQNYENAFNNQNNKNNNKYNNNNNANNSNSNKSNTNQNYLNSESTKNINNNNNNNSNNNNELQRKLINLEQTYNELVEDNKKLKLIFDECTQTIYEAIKHYSPNLFDEENTDACEASVENNTNKHIRGALINQNNLLTINNILDSRDSATSNYSASTDKDLISKAVEMFKKYNKEINEKNKKLEGKVNELEMNSRTFKIMADEYKNAWELALKKSQKLQFDSVPPLNPNEIGELSERLKTDLANFTVEDLIEAGHVVIDDSGRGSARKNNNNFSDNSCNFNKENLLPNSNNNNKLINNNLNLLSDFERAVNVSRNDFLKNDERKNIEFKSFNIGGDSLIELNFDASAEKENYIRTNKLEEEIMKNSKFNYSAFLEKYNNPAEYKILAYKKLENDLIWYLLIPKSTQTLSQSSDSSSANKNATNNANANNCRNNQPAAASADSKSESIFAKNSSNISDLDFMMINKIRKKSSNKLNKFSSLEKDSGRKTNNNNINTNTNKSNNNNNSNNLNLNLNLVKNYDDYMWVPGKLIANNLTNFEFEKNSSEALLTDTVASNKDEVLAQQASSSSSVCEKCEKNKKELSFKLEHLTELEKKYTSMLDEKDSEVKELVNIQEELLKKLSEKEEKIDSYKDTMEKKLSGKNNKNLESINSNSDSNMNSINNSKTVSLEKYEILLNEFREEQDKGYELMKVYEELKRDYDNLSKKLFNLQNENNNVNVNKSLKNLKSTSALNTENNNLQREAMDKSFNNKTNNEVVIKDLNDVEVVDLLEMYNRNSLEGISDLKEFALKQKLNSQNFNTVPTGANNRSALNATSSNKLNLDSEANDFTLNMNRTDGYYTVNYY